MTKRQFLISLAFVSVFSFLGGIFGGMLTGGQNLLAQKTDTEPKTQYIVRLNCKFLEVDLLTVNYGISAKTIHLKNEDSKLIGFIGADHNGMPNILLAPRQKNAPLFSDALSYFSINFSSDGQDPVISFTDKDKQERIKLGLDRNRPQLSIKDEGVLRLQIGTNQLPAKASGNAEKIKGSIFAFDNKGEFIGRFPSK
jgi:hypothetical protein